MDHQTFIENRAIEELHKHMNEEDYGAIYYFRDEASANSTKTQNKLLETMKAAHLEAGKINAWSMTDRKYQLVNWGLVTTMKLEISTEQGKCQETLVWEFRDDKIMLLKDYTIHKQK